MDNDEIEKQQKNDDQEIIKEVPNSKIKAKKKFVSSLIDFIPLAVGICLADAIVELISIKSNLLSFIFYIAIVTIDIIIKEIVTALFIFKRRSK